MNEFGRLVKLPNQYELGINIHFPTSQPGWKSMFEIMIERTGAFEAMSFAF